MYLVQIKDAEEVKFILLLVMIFFGMIARFAEDWESSKDRFRIISVNFNISVEDINGLCKFLPEILFLPACSGACIFVFFWQIANGGGPFLGSR